MTIVISERPLIGQFQRYCKACGEPYLTWNFVLCPDCETIHQFVRPFDIVEGWRS